MALTVKPGLSQLSLVRCPVPSMVLYVPDQLLIAQSLTVRLFGLMI